MGVEVQDGVLLIHLEPQTPCLLQKDFEILTARKEGGRARDVVTN